MAGLKRALLCKGTLPISCFLALPVHRALLPCLALVDLLKRMLPGSFALEYAGFRLVYKEFRHVYGQFQRVHKRFWHVYKEFWHAYKRFWRVYGEFWHGPFWPGIADFGRKMRASLHPAA